MCACFSGRRQVLAIVVAITWSSIASASSQDAKPFIIHSELAAKSPFDKVRKENRHKVHELELKAGEIYMIDLRSIDFNTFLRLEDAAGTKVGEIGEMSAADRNSRLGFVPKKTAIYRAVVMSVKAEQTGRYTLQVGTMKKVGARSIIEGKLTEKSAKSKMNKFYQEHPLTFKAGEFWLIDLISQEFDSHLLATNPKKEPIAFDEGGGQINPSLALSIAQTGEHLLKLEVRGSEFKGGLHPAIAKNRTC